MHTELDSRITRKLAGVAYLAFLLLSPLGLGAEPRSKVSDFGAGIVEDLPGTLPVDLVEEKAPVNSPAAPALTKDADVPSLSAEEDLDVALPERPETEITTALNVRDVEISALLKSFSKLSSRNYIVDSTVKGKVSILLPTAVTLSEALRILDSVLLLKGFTTVPVAENTWKVIPAKDARQTTIPTLDVTPAEPSDQLVTQLVRLRYVKAPELQQTLSQFVSREGLISASETTNALILIDSAANIERLVGLTKQLDVAALDQDITIVPVLHAEAKDIAEKVNDILGTRDDTSDTRTSRSMMRTPGSPATPGTPPTGVITPTSANKIGSSGLDKRVLPVKVIPDERTNSLIVVADPEMTLKVRALVEQLDSELDRSGARFYVYRLKHADAEELADIIGALVGGGGSSGSRESTKTAGSSLSRSSSGLSSSRRSSRERNRTTDGDERTTSSSRSGGTTSVSSGSGDGRVAFEGEVSIAADPKTNSLVINASKGDYQRLKSVIDELDVKRRQVLVEATILEVSLTKDEGMGIEFQATGGNDNGGVVAQTNYGGLTNLLTNPARLSDLSIAAASTGSLTLPGGLTIPSQALLISAVKSNQNVNVLSSPNILTTDNEEAEIIVGENVPFVTSTSTSDTNLNNTFNQIERQDVGITLRITPQIGTAEWVALKIFVEISNVVSTTRNDPNGPTTSIRTTETNVEVKSGQMIVTGGLISDSMSESARGVPYWEDIPVLGNFFRRDDENRRRTNLLIFITPKVVSDQYDAREETIAKRDVIQSTIAEQQIEPNRQEVLRSGALDRVAEVYSGDIEAPTTITPPTPSLSQDDEAAVERTKALLKSLTTSDAPVAKAAVPATDAAKQEPPPTKRNRITADEVIDLTVSPKLPGESATLSRESSYVVLRRISGDGPTTQGLVIAGNLDQAGARFFQIGAQYAYSNANSSEERFVVIGRYPSKESASGTHKQITSWRALSPQELALLGKQYWVAVP